MGKKWQREKNKLAQHKRMGIGLFKTVDSSRYAMCSGGGNTDLRGKFKEALDGEPGYVYAKYIPFCNGTRINDGPLIRSARIRAQMSIFRMRGKYITNNRSKRK